ncbi:MAG: DUF5320 domain-containing protein [Firmicutes bacterium]|nr:DUF5320 domain-containing protein [Bacillota bacterium]
MPRGDGTGPMGAGPLTGRGFGVCKGARVLGRVGLGAGLCLGLARGLGFGRGLGRGFGFNQTSGETQKELLQQQKEILQNQIKAVNEQLENL